MIRKLVISPDISEAMTTPELVVSLTTLRVESHHSLLSDYGII